VWKLAKDLWLRKHPIWPELSLGSVLGYGLVTISDEKGRTLPGASRLYRILISEFVFVIWKIRNDSVIGQGGDPIPDNKIHNKWLHAINLRLNFDCVLTNHTKYGKQNSIKTSLVLQTWSLTLADEDKLPENWIREPKVLVGTEPPSSHPAPQHSGRRGRNR
jgi:ribonuclease HI